MQASYGRRWGVDIVRCRIRTEEECLPLKVQVQALCRKETGDSTLIIRDLLRFAPEGGFYFQVTSFAIILKCSTCRHHGRRSSPCGCRYRPISRGVMMPAPCQCAVCLQRPCLYPSIRPIADDTADGASWDSTIWRHGVREWVAAYPVGKKRSRRRDCESSRY